MLRVIARGLHFSIAPPRWGLSRHCETLKGLAPKGAGTIGHSHCLLHIWSTMPDLKKLAEIIEPEAKALGFDLVRVAWFDRGAEGSDEPTLQVMAERPDTRQLVIDDCAALSHRISDLFDELDPIEEAYRSRGQLPRHRPSADPVEGLLPTGRGMKPKSRRSEPIENQKRFRGELAGVDDVTWFQSPTALAPHTH
jgi:ribosome maturation factor RimP